MWKPAVIGFPQNYAVCFESDIAERLRFLTISLFEAVMRNTRIIEQRAAAPSIVPPVTMREYITGEVPSGA